MLGLHIALAFDNSKEIDLIGMQESMKRSALLLSCVALLTLLALPVTAIADSEPAPDANESPENKTSGLPLPRFASLRFEEVNVRTGPGSRYPIRWVYKRKAMPIEIIEEFGDWRKLKDVEGDEGWSHKSQLTGTRSVIIREDSTLQRYPEADAPALLKAHKGVTARLLECNADWCQMQIQSYKAWLPKKRIWGVYPKEIYQQ